MFYSAGLGIDFSCSKEGEHWERRYKNAFQDFNAALDFKLLPVPIDPKRAAQRG